MSFPLGSRFARDHLGYPWIVFEKDGQAWGLSIMNADGVSMWWMKTTHDSDVKTDLKYPDAYRQLTYLSEEL